MASSSQVQRVASRKGTPWVDPDPADAAAGSGGLAAAAAMAAAVAGDLSQLLSQSESPPEEDAVLAAAPPDEAPGTASLPDDIDLAAMWPSMMPTTKLSSLTGSGTKELEEAADLAAGQGQASQGSAPSALPVPPHMRPISPPDARPATDWEPSTERVEQVLGAAFDRLWRDRPAGNPPPEEGSGEGAQALGSVDGYISNYFRQVAELSRESVYQSHQRAILWRMREDVVSGDRTGNMRELDERIQRVEINDRNLQAEIACRMRIVVERDRGRESCCVERAPCCVPAACCAASASDSNGASSSSLAGRSVPGCRPGECSVQ